MSGLGFLDLPAELRDMVHSQVIMDNERPARYHAQTNSLTHPSSLTRVNHQVAREFTALLLRDCAAIVFSIVNLDFSHLITWTNNLPEATTRTFLAPEGEDRDEDSNGLVLQFANIDSRSLYLDARRVFIKLTLTHNGNADDQSLLEAWLDCFDNGKTRFALPNTAYIVGEIDYDADEAIQAYASGANRYLWDRRPITGEMSWRK